MKYLWIGILGLFATLTCSAATINVCETCPVSSIKAGIAQATAGDVVVISEGVYKEYDIHITHPISIIGKGNPVIDAEMRGTIFSVSADSFLIEGITFKNVGHSYTKEFAGILVNRSNHFVIRNNVLENMFFGILIEKSKLGVISGNEVWGQTKNESNSGNGIHIWHSSEMKVFDNRTHHMRDGIYFEFVDQAEIYGNESWDNIRYGLHFMFSNNDSYHHNTFRNNGAGVAVMFSKMIEMHHNKFILNWGTASYGLLLKEIYDADIRNNLFEQNTIAINVEGSTRINYQDNLILRNGWAVKITGGCYENIFVNNNFSHNAFDLAFNGHLNGSAFDGNYWSDYTGYDMNRDGVGDVPYRPVKLFSYIVNQTPETIVLLRSLFVDIINFSEKVSPVFTPDNLIDNEPIMPGKWKAPDYEFFGWNK
jgi:nitrous oxidase accessory protein